MRENGESGASHDAFTRPRELTELWSREGNEDLVVQLYGTETLKGVRLRNRDERNKRKTKENIMAKTTDSIRPDA